MPTLYIYLTLGGLVLLGVVAIWWNHVVCRNFNRERDRDRLEIAMSKADSERTEALLAAVEAEAIDDIQDR